MRVLKYRKLIWVDTAISDSTTGLLEATAVTTIAWTCADEAWMMLCHTVYIIYILGTDAAAPTTGARSCADEAWMMLAATLCILADVFTSFTLTVPKRVPKQALNVLMKW